MLSCQRLHPVSPEIRNKLRADPPGTCLSGVIDIYASRIVCEVPAWVSLCRPPRYQTLGKWGPHQRENTPPLRCCPTPVVLIQAFRVFSVLQRSSTFEFEIPGMRFYILCIPGCIPQTIEALWKRANTVGQHTQSIFNFSFSFWLCLWSIVQHNDWWCH